MPNEYQRFKIVSGYAEILRRIAYGVTTPKSIGGSWDHVFAGNVTYEAEGWRFVIFNDCDSLDYTDSLRSPDGIELAYDDLNGDAPDGARDPISYEGHLSSREEEMLLRALKAAG